MIGVFFFRKDEWSIYKLFFHNIRNSQVCIFWIYIRHKHVVRRVVEKGGGETAPFLVTDIFLNLQLSIEMNFERFFRIVFKIIKRSYHIHIFRYKNIYPRCRKKNRQNSYLWYNFLTKCTFDIVFKGSIINEGRMYY